MLALLVAVSALTAVGFFTSRVSLAVDQQAGEVLAADLRLQSRAPIEPRVFRSRRRAPACSTAELFDVPERRFQGRRQRAHGDSCRLARRIRCAVALKVADEPFGPAREVTRLPAAAKRGSKRGCSRSSARASAIASASAQTELTIAQVLDYRPDQGSQFVDLAPTLLMRLEDVPPTEAHAGRQPHLARRAVRRRHADTSRSSRSS